jgi:hypothetical protein
LQRNRAGFHIALGPGTPTQSGGDGATKLFLVPGDAVGGFWPSAMATTTFDSVTWRVRSIDASGHTSGWTAFKNQSVGFWNPEEQKCVSYAASQ